MTIKLLTVKDLREALEDVPDDVIVSVAHKFHSSNHTLDEFYVHDATFGIYYGTDDGVFTIFVDKYKKGEVEFYV